MVKKSQKITAEFLRSLPQKPGVYLMRDARDVVIYVGKAIHLRKRVRSYFLGHDDRPQVRYLVALVRRIETVVTEDERQALVLESDLIKKYKPRYNVRLKDDKAHLIVRLDGEQQYPRLELVRKIENDGAKYYGPFPYGYELKTMLEVIKETLPLRTCTDRVFHNRVRPCLEYQIRRCCGPCCLPVEPRLYAEYVAGAVEILQGKSERAVERLHEEMERASVELRYEDAAILRDRIAVLQRVHDEKPQLNFSFRSQDAFAIHSDGEQGEFSVLSVRRGRLFGAKSFGLSEAALGDEELLSSLIWQYYDGEANIPDEILVEKSFEASPAIADLLSERRGTGVVVRTPRRGSSARLLELARDNARENFLSRHHQKIGQDRVLKKLQLELGLEQMPRTIECMDISHFQGGETVASVVQFRDGQPDKTQYRQFVLSIQGKPDDFASMREVAMRHLSRGQEENSLPDLLVVDGGKQQLAEALAVREELGLGQLPMVGLAKKRRLPIRFRPYRDSFGRGAKPERIFLPGEVSPIIIPPDDEAMLLLERLRDEAHRFAITFHRKRRAKRTFASVLDDIPGIGTARRKELQRAFGSGLAVGESSVEEIIEKTSLPEMLARRVLKVVRVRLKQMESAVEE